jgi:hypothetical protein
MARIPQRFNVDADLNDQMAALASASQTSRSEQLNLAVQQALADLPTMFSTVLMAPAQWGAKLLATFMVDKELLDHLGTASEKLAVSKDTIVKLAMRSYILSKQDVTKVKDDFSTTNPNILVQSCKGSPLGADGTAGGAQGTRGHLA